MSASDSRIGNLNGIWSALLRVGLVMFPLIVLGFTGWQLRIEGKQTDHGERIAVIENGYVSQGDFRQALAQSLEERQNLKAWMAKLDTRLDKIEATSTTRFERIETLLMNRAP